MYDLSELIIFPLFVTGLFFGSFLYVIISRFMRLGSMVTGRSECEYCQHLLAWYDLFPLFSFLFLGGKCRYCKKKISFIYPFFELLTGVLFVVSYLFLPHNTLLPVIFSLFLTIIFILVFFIDLKYGLIPFIFVLPATMIVYIYLFLTQPQLLITHIISALGAGLFFLLLFTFTKGKGMGFGDVVYAFFMGSLLGFPRIITGMYIAFILGAIIGVLYLVLQKKKLRGTAIPFGPFLVVGTYIALLIPQEMITNLLSFWM